MAMPPHPNPILAVTLPIVLDRPPEMHAPTEALRLALLGVGAVHQAYLQLQNRSSSRGLAQPYNALGMMGMGDALPPLSPLGSGTGASSLVLGGGGGMRGMMSQNEGMGIDMGGAEDARSLLAFSAMMRLQATRCLAVACRDPEETRSDAALGATMAVVLIDVRLSLSSPFFLTHSAC